MMRKTLLSLFIVIFMNFCAASSFGDNDPVVARIGEKTILMSDFQRWLSFSGEERRKALEKDSKMRASLLQQIVTGMAVAAQARKEGFDRRPEVKENMELLMNNFIAIEYLDKIIARRAEVKDEDVKRYYDEHKEEFRLPERVRARHILIRAERTASEAEQKKAREKAKELLGRIKGGEDFRKLAVEFSDDPGSKRKEGDVGFFSRGMMAPEFEKTAFLLKPGEVSEPVQTNFGFHIIKVEEKKDPSVQPYEEVEGKLRKKLELDIRKKAVDAYVEQVSREAGVEIDIDAFFGTGSGPHMNMK